jgi:hypothetical protein
MMRKAAIWSGRRSSDSASLFRGALLALSSRVRSCCVRVAVNRRLDMPMPVSTLQETGFRWGGSRNA